MLHCDVGRTAPASSLRLRRRGRITPGTDLNSDQCTKALIWSRTVCSISLVHKWWHCCLVCAPGTCSHVCASLDWLLNWFRIKWRTAGEARSADADTPTMHGLKVDDMSIRWLSAADIEKVTGWSKTKVYHWRKNNGLAVNKTPLIGVTSKAGSGLGKGYDIRKIAKALGVSVADIELALTGKKVSPIEGSAEKQTPVPVPVRDAVLLRRMRIPEGAPIDTRVLKMLIKKAARSTSDDVQKTALFGVGYWVDSVV